MLKSSRYRSVLSTLSLLALGCGSPRDLGPGDHALRVGTESSALVTKTGRLYALGKCLQVAGRSEFAGARTEIAFCDSSQAQNWTYTSEKQLISSQGYCLTVSGYASPYANYLTIQPCERLSIEQMFRIKDSGEIRGTSISPRDVPFEDSRCLDVYGSNTADGTMVWYHDCNNSTAQKWYSDNGLSWTTTYLLAMGGCLDLPGGNSYDGASLQLYQCNGTSSQVFRLSPLGQIREWNGGRCLTVGGAVSPYASALFLSECSSESQDQVFTISGTSIVSQSQGRCLDVRNSGSGNGTPIWIHDCNGSDAQSWGKSWCSRSDAGGCPIECCSISGGTQLCSVHSC